MKKPEILAPVGNREMLTAAVFAGADAVYLGLDSFNARRNAKNFTTESLREAVEFCHVRGVKVYLTMNTLVSDKEMEQAVEMTVAAAKCGIDGIITADIGFAKVIRQVLPQLPLHASTQMTVHSVAAIPALKRMGFSRVVVSREMNKKELKEFCAVAKAENIEVEVFVHGALCMSMSGQCLLSAMLGGRSGNRGLCAGPCRLPFKSENGNEYALSLKDLSIIPYLNELKEMGVASYKIEGRMKRPEYVAAAVHSCRNSLDKSDKEDNREHLLENVFSRSGFTDGYYNNNLGKDMFGIRTKEDVAASSKVIAAIHDLYRNENQRVALFGKIQIKEGKCVKFDINDGKNFVSVLGDIPEIATNRADDKQTVEQRLLKTGGTPYYFKSIEIDLDDNLCLKASTLNALRREALNQISIKRARTPIIDVNGFEKISGSSNKSLPKKVVRIENLSQLTERVEKSDLVIIPISVDENQIPDGIMAAVEMPRGISNEKVIKNRLVSFKEKGITTAFCGTLASAELARLEGFEIISDFGFNIYNSYSADYHLKSGAKAVVVSPELLLNEAKQLSDLLPKGIISYGRLPLMLTKNCPVKLNDCNSCNKDRCLTDRMGVRFPVRCQNGYAELLNSRVIWLADKDRKGFDFEILYFTDETPERIDRVLNLYKDNAKPDSEYTRGLYFRGVE